MAIRLTIAHDGMSILVEGQLKGADLPDLKASYESANAPCSLDLSGLRSADADGIRALRSLMESGTELHGANPYIRQLLYEAGN